LNTGLKIEFSGPGMSILVSLISSSWPGKRGSKLAIVVA